MFNPASTYRIQFHKGFNFADFEKIIPYLVKLGVSTLYASPIFEAAPGSMHGYDTVNPLAINPEIGTLEQLRRISKKLKKHHIGWLQDIVPNHMAFHSQNKWLMDVLEKGPRSAFKNYFDQSLSSDLYTGPIMAPFLGSSLDDTIDQGELIIALENGQLFFKYFDNTWPIALKAYPLILNSKGVVNQEFDTILENIEEAVNVSDAAAFEALASRVKANLTALAVQLNEVIAAANGNKPLLKTIAGEQYYRLCSWTETDHEINYRRFFTVNSLICLNIQRKEVFDHFHSFIIELCLEGIFQGLRIDHIDGLYNPDQYLKELRHLTGDQVYIVVEKILEAGEQLPHEWPIQGSTGYDYLALVNNLFTSENSREDFSRFYQKTTEEKRPVKQLVEEKKEYILRHHMGGELNNLTRFFIASGLADQAAGETIAFDTIKETIAIFLVKCPVYRYYAHRFPLEGKESSAVRDIVKSIKKVDSRLNHAADLLNEVLLETPGKGNAAFDEKALSFYRRCMQFSGPLMAKGVEDTLMYTYNRFIDHNEVGDSPDAFGISPLRFHKEMIRRQQEWPLSVNGTATHDTKRGEDVRARLNVLSDLGKQWLDTVEQWQSMNRPLKVNGAPDDNDELFIYQTLIGSYPMPDESDKDFPDRISAYLEKALREGKQHTDWATPNTAYEDGVKSFVAKLLDKNGDFWKSFVVYHKYIADFGVVNSLAQVLLKFTCPGVPDVYQGCEHWDLSLVDPDNRRLVDYKKHAVLLGETENINNTYCINSLWHNRFNGEIKIWLTRNLLRLRKSAPDFFEHADYLPLPVNGKYKEHVLAFARVFRNIWYVAVVPVNAAVLCFKQNKSIPELDWADTAVELPGEAPDTITDTLINNIIGKEKHVRIQTAFEHLPFAIWKLEQPVSERSSGLLLPVFSLPSAFGIGDFGPEARNFAKILARAAQKYWQVLPLNPADAQNQYSPYSSHSGMAGNTLFISPELLADDGLLDFAETEHYRVKNRHHIDYADAGEIKSALCNRAWQNYNSTPAPYLKKSFEVFCKTEQTWLDDYALYLAIKQKHHNKPWYEWADEYKFKDKVALETFAAENGESVVKIKWFQFIFNKQWLSLKYYCKSLGIQLLGDLPFYVAYDSADVWSCPELFSLDDQLNMKLVAGVPPDYFNAEGQLWGMPVFDWNALSGQKYAWWVKRIRRNLEWFDLLRMDHFRAFSSYWAVPAGEKTAVNGHWEQVPGPGFFNTLQKEIGKLPFVAEDLGDIDEDVYTLRDQFGLPGMKVLQFAFGDDMPHSPHIPHNYTANHFAYTGTHDNNTTRGWFEAEAGKLEKQQIKRYTDQNFNSGEVSLAFVKMIMASAAKTSIFPVQDILCLDESARLNTPAGTTGNWVWRLKPRELHALPEKKLKEWTRLYNRS